MKVAEKVKAKVNKIPPGRVFRYSDIGVGYDEYGAAAKILSRMVKAKAVKRLSAGVFYKPKATVFGELGPNESEQLRPYLFDGKKRIAYITGPALFNRLSLTTQVPIDIDIATPKKRASLRAGNVTVRFVKSYAEVNNKNYHLLGILDVLKDFKKIPDLKTELIIKRLRAIVTGLSNREKKDLIKYALFYPPRTRALLGALLESMETEQRKLVVNLKQSLNPLSSYLLGISQEVLPNAKRWSIV